MAAPLFSSRRPLAAPSRLLAAALVLGGCGAEPEETSAAALRLRFPAHADAVLSAREAFAPAVDGFRLGATEPGGAWVRAARPEVVLPLDGSGVIRFRRADGGEIRVRELGAAGEGAMAERAVSYRRAGGTSFWTATDGGVEEWLLLEEGVARGGEAVAAWEVEGALLRERGVAVELVDEARGAPVLRVTAPRAHAASGRAVAPALRVRGARIELSVDMGDAGGEAVLVDPEWEPAGQMHVEHDLGPTATLLPSSGKVLVTGGSSFPASAELYDPTDDTWSLMRPMSAARRFHTATLLQDDQVLVVGGEPDVGRAPTDTVELYDPMTGAWTRRKSPGTARRSHSATLLRNGKVLVAGGATIVGGSESLLYSAELYDPTADTWTSAASMNLARSGHAAALLPDGNVLVAGGVSYDDALRNAEIYDPDTNIWTPTGSMTTRANRSDAFMTQLHNGEVLVVGESGVERYDPKVGTWSRTSRMVLHHVGFSATTLHSGKVLVVGESSYVEVETETSRRAQLYDPEADTWTVTAPAGDAYENHTATRLPNGDVLLIGDSDAPERYTILGAECASEDDCASAPCVDGVCCESPCSEPCHTCASRSSPGRCVLQPKGSDARRDCAREGCDGSCDGFGACSAVPRGGLCIPAQCSDDETRSMRRVLCPADGASCADPSSEAREVVDCAPYRCDQIGGTCKDRCSSLLDCAPGFACDLSGHCARPPPVEISGCGVGAAAVAATASRGGLGALVLALLAVAHRRASVLRGRPARRRGDA
ncbi:kelch repeat-containing protein [Sorangium sp. So ce1389]|uniref:Kelch repeat-containing protein n=1 Tax=Sorangium sp. So ce1389 TaxID=3133336 RepID=UPI003F63876B